MFTLFITLFNIVALSQKVNSCGITTHIEIAHRAFTHYDHLIGNQTSASKLIEKYESAFQAGNPYPDSFYPSICHKGVYAEISEDTHWVPFLNASINYIRHKYRQPYNEDALKLIVFILGFTSHQMADVTWHSLGVEQGFLAAMGYVNFHGSFSAAHGVGDFGGDVVNQFELNLNYIAELTEWYIPYDDLYNIYFELYGREQITREVIIECSTLLYLGRLGEKLAVSLLYPEYFSKSAFLADKLNDYFLGGLDDMAAWTQISWDKVFYMLEQGTDKCHLEHNIIDLTCNGGKMPPNKKSKFKNRKTYKENFEHLLDTSYLNVTIQNNHSLLISSSKKFNDLYSSIKNADKKKKKTYEIQYSNAVKSNVSYFIENENANLGWSLAAGDLNNDQMDDLIVSAPVYSKTNLYQNGAVYVLLRKEIPIESLDIEKFADLIIDPPEDAVNSRFGHSVIVLDLNRDGFNDIVVSAPSYNLRNISYEGKVFVYFGGDKVVKRNYSVEITCKNYQYCNLGWSLSKGDINSDGHDDLIISSPYASTCESQCGYVGVVFSRQNIPSVMDAAKLDWVLNGNMGYEWFGYSTVAKFGYLAVGAPESRICKQSNCNFDDQDKQAIGRVYLYKYPSNTPIVTFIGDTEFEQFGYSFDLSKQLNKTVIAISSMSKDSKINKPNGINLKRGGVVQVYDIDNYQSSIALLKSDRSYAGFGSKVKFFDINNDNFDDLLIGAQLRSESFYPIDNVQQGLVYAFKGGPSFPQGNYTDDCSEELIPCPSKKAFKIFEKGENKSRFGSEFTLIKSLKKGNKLAISSIHSNQNSKRLSGKVNIFYLNY